MNLFELLLRLVLWSSLGLWSLIAYAQSIAPEPLASELAAASDYEVVFNEYDWALNSAQ